MIRDKQYLTWQDVRHTVLREYTSFLFDWYTKHPTSFTPDSWNKVWGVPRGGVPIALLLQTLFPNEIKVVDSADEADLIVDDIVDSGKTRNRYAASHPGKPFFVPYQSDKKTWVVFPWEKKDEGINDNIARILEWYGCDPTDHNIESLKTALQNHLSDDTTR